jgi:hypothetical protein
MKLITYVFRNAILQPLLLSIMLVFSSSFTCVMASSAVSPNITINTSSMLGYRTFNASALSPYSFGVSIDFPGGHLNKSDLYFGIIQPKSDSISTWVTVDGVSNLKDGLAPIVKGIDMETKFVFSLSNLLGQDIKYQFTESDPYGMYLIFALLVVSDRTPFDTKNWVEVSIAPLFFNP